MNTAKGKTSKPKAVADQTHNADSTGAVAKDTPKRKAAKPKAVPNQAHARGSLAFFALCFVAGLAAYRFGPDIPGFFASMRDDGDASAVPSSIDKADFVINPSTAAPAPTDPPTMYTTATHAPSRAPPHQPVEMDFIYHYDEVFETSKVFADLSDSWRKDASKKLKTISSIQSLWERVKSSVPPSIPEFMFLHDITMVSLSQYLTSEENWLLPPAASFDFFDADFRDVPANNFQAFVTRIHMPRSRMVVWGDIHGSFDGLVTSLEALTMGDDACLDGKTLALREGCSLLVLGDFVDRGERSVEVLFTLMLLRAINGPKMTIVRGNHEDMNMCMRYGLAHEVTAKYPKDKQLVLGRFLRLFQLFPVAVYVGVPEGGERHYLQFSHGVFEFGYIPNNLLAAAQNGTFTFEPLNTVNRTKTLEMLQSSHPEMHKRIAKKCASNANVAREFTGAFTPLGPSQPQSLGTCWTDLLVRPVSTPLEDFYYVAGRGTAYGLGLLEALFNLSSTPGQARLHGVVRGHQHNNAAGPMLNRLIESRGMVHGYGEGKGPSSSCREVGGPRRDDSKGEFFVVTTISASESNLDFDYNSYAVAHLDAEWQNWVIAHHWKPVTSPQAAWNVCKHGPGSSTA